MRSVTLTEMLRLTRLFSFVHKFFVKLALGLVVTADQARLLLSLKPELKKFFGLLHGLTSTVDEVAHALDSLHLEESLSKRA